MRTREKARSVFFGATWLIGLYVALQLIADVTAVKQVALLGLALPAGSLAFAATFTVRDLIHKRLGRHAAEQAINVAAVMNVLLALYIVLVNWLPAPPWWSGQAAFTLTLMPVLRITFASIVAEWSSERLDTVLYALFVRTFGNKYQWGRVMFSNFFSAPVDSIIFGTLAFAGVFPVPALVTLVIGQSIFKWIVGLVSVPAIYLVGGGEQECCEQNVCCKDHA